MGGTRTSGEHAAATALPAVRPPRVPPARRSPRGGTSRSMTATPTPSDTRVARLVCHAVHAFEHGENLFALQLVASFVGSTSLLLKTASDGQLPARAVFHQMHDPGIH